MKTELRIGNFIHHNPENAPFLDSYLIVSELTKDVINTYYEFEGQIFNVKNRTDYYPIPLTKDWFLKFGFKYNNSLLSYENKSICFDYNIENKEVSIIKWNVFLEIESIFKTKNIINVHQLQNLYFVLTGEELTVK